VHCLSSSYGRISDDVSWHSELGLCKNLYLFVNMEEKKVEYGPGVSLMKIL
jgi:hypothetical protein